MNLALADLALWTPVALHLDPPAVDWADFRLHRFAEPFLDQTVERLVGGGCDLVRTDLAALQALDAGKSLEPSGIVLHLARCGSTLVSRLLGTVPGVVVVSEPAPVNTLLGADPARLDEAAAVAVLRLLVRALGRIRLGDERHLVLKLTSWNVRRLALLRRAFPEVPLVWVERDPAEVLASLLAEPPGWLDPRLAPLFGMAPDEAARLDRTGLAARIVKSLLDAAAGAGALAIDYRALPDAVWTGVAPHFGIALDQEAIERMRVEATLSAKLPGRVAYAPVPRPVSPAIAEVVAQFRLERLANPVGPAPGP